MSRQGLVQKWLKFCRSSHLKGHFAFCDEKHTIEDKRDLKTTRNVKLCFHCMNVLLIIP